LGWFSIQVEDVVAEAVDVLCEVGTDGGDGVLRDGFSALLKLADEPSQRAERSSLSEM
jgi:hypothetical protein